MHVYATCFTHVHVTHKDTYAPLIYIYNALDLKHFITCEAFNRNDYPVYTHTDYHNGPLHNQITTHVDH